MKIVKSIGFLFLYTMILPSIYALDPYKKIFIKSCAKNPKCLRYDNLEVTTTFIKKKKKSNKPQEYYAICGPVREICDFKLTPILFCDSPFVQGSSNPLAVYSKNFIGKMIQDVFYYNKFTQLDKIQKEALAFSQPAPFVEKSMSAGFRNAKIKNKLLAEKKTKTYSYFFKKFAPVFNPDQLNRRFIDIDYQLNGPYWFTYESILRNQLCSGLDIVSQPTCFVRNYKKAEYIENHLRYFCSSIEESSGVCRRKAIEFIEEVASSSGDKEFQAYLNAYLFYLSFKNKINNKEGLNNEPVEYEVTSMPPKFNREKASQPIGSQQPSHSKFKKTMCNKDTGECSEVSPVTPSPGPNVDAPGSLQQKSFSNKPPIGW